SGKLLDLLGGPDALTERMRTLRFSAICSARTDQNPSSSGELPNEATLLHVGGRTFEVAERSYREQLSGRRKRILGRRDRANQNVRRNCSTAFVSGYASRHNEGCRSNVAINGTNDRPIRLLRRTIDANRITGTHGNAVYFRSKLAVEPLQTPRRVNDVVRCRAGCAGTWDGVDVVEAEVGDGGATVGQRA